MGAMISTLRMVLQTFKGLIDDFEVVSKRLSESPGIPLLNSSVPYWTIPPSPIAQHGKNADLPHTADIIIIGSGITGTSIAKALLEHTSGETNHAGRLSVVMLEARDVCSGATGRNGGHASPIIYNEYFDLKKAHGSAIALEIIQFRLAHISALINLAKEEGLLEESQARTVENFDAFLQSEFFTKARDELEAFIKEVPQEISNQFGVTDDCETIKKLQLATSVIGLITKPGASIHPYRLVTGILSKLLDRFSNFHLYSHTPCTEISTENGKYIVSTPKGKIQASHIIHATNAWSSHLLPGLRRKIVPIKAHMSTQRPGKGLHVTNNVDDASNFSTPDWTGQRAFVFYPGNVGYAYDYLTQLLPAPSSRNVASSGESDLPNDRTALSTSGEFMFGGGIMIGGSSESALLGVVGVADDTHSDFAVEAYLSGALPMYFANNWGEEGSSSSDETHNSSNIEWRKGRVKALWTGIVGMSADSNPWVGRVPLFVSKRPEPRLATNNSSQNKAFTLAPPGEWVCGGYSGEGMVHAWLCGRALVRMMLGVSDGQTDGSFPTLPAPFLITEKRVKQAKIEDFMDNI